MFACRGWFQRGVRLSRFGLQLLVQRWQLPLLLPQSPAPCCADAPRPETASELVGAQRRAARSAYESSRCTLSCKAHTLGSSVRATPSTLRSKSGTALYAVHPSRSELAAITTFKK
eukprot:2531260-Rhodomonas_salina.1